MNPWRLPPAAYAGIGSRETPILIQNTMRVIAHHLAERGWTLRTGGAPGADEAFRVGSPPDQVELYLPWPGFNGHTSPFGRPTRVALEIAANHHPAWRGLSHTARMLHARNVHQVLGLDCASPASFVLCWTRDGAHEHTTSRTGGTGQAIRIALDNGIPVWNLGHGEHSKLWNLGVHEMKLGWSA